MPSPNPPEMPGDRWHKETYEESLKPKSKTVACVVMPEDSVRDEKGWADRDDSGWVS